MSGSDPGPSPPSVNGWTNTSGQRLTTDVCQVAQTLTLVAMLPSQMKLRPSNWALPISGSTATLRPNVPITLPSFGATE